MTPSTLPRTPSSCRLTALLYRLGLVGVFACACNAHAQTFDWTLLDGLWAESTEHQFGCRPDNVHQRFNVAADRKSVAIQFDRIWKIGTGKSVVQIEAAILSATPNKLIIRYGPELGEMPPAMREWELRFIGPGTYRWRSTAWPPGVYNEVIGVKCSP
jgi:hypothetical protein